VGTRRRNGSSKEAKMPRADEHEDELLAAFDTGKL
jgi:hypothetical protein